MHFFIKSSHFVKSYGHLCMFQILGIVRVGGQGGGDNSIQFINFGRVGDKSFKGWRQKTGVEGLVTFRPAVLDKECHVPVYFCTHLPIY